MSIKRGFCLINARHKALLYLTSVFIYNVFIFKLIISKDKVGF
jgi:hypothetical protein